MQTPLAFIKKEASKLKVSNKAILGNLSHLRQTFRGTDLAQKCAVSEPPLRSELFSSDQMEQHGKTLAGMHKLGRGHIPDKLLSRLSENEGVLTGTRLLLMDAITTDRRITPAGEWLLDNFYLIEEQIRTARRHLPKGYSRELPKLLNGPSAGLPRVYDIALETIAHGDGRVDAEGLGSFVAAYQTITTLKLGELWAIPIMLRLALIENLRRVAALVAADRIDRDRADYWADEMTGTAEKDPKKLILVIADMARSEPPMVSSFVAELARRLQGQGPALAMPLNWIEQRLSESGRTIKQLVQEENRKQAILQVSLSNSISSLRFLGATNWRAFVETLSAVENTLRRDAAGVYEKMDFSTRDYYRHIVEKIAKNSRLSENEVAAGAVNLAQRGAADISPDDRSAHVGFYLIDRGRTQLEQLAELRESFSHFFERISSRFPLLFYAGTIIILTIVFSGFFVTRAFSDGIRDWTLGLVGTLTLLSGSHLAVALVNWLVTLLVMPRPLPRVDLSRGIPPELRTLVVIPTMLTSPRNVEDLTEALEVRFLANQDDNLHFGLLTDFRDSDKETTPEDGQLLMLARQRIEHLNKKYKSLNNDTFFLFHRPRRFNPQERTWMGYERKRGKLADLNYLLRNGRQGDKGERFSLIVGNTEVLSGVKYVITLDTDTQLPRDSAWQLIGTMAHPLNRALYDEGRQRIVEGYSILQPRVAASLPGTNRSRYARMCGSEPGIDPYTRAVSDVYQDLFHEGSFIGKGIYDVDAFERSLGGRFPENRVLSHDLIEGCYARSGLLSDVLLYEEYPSRYSADVARWHRWVRGDWQIARWLMTRVPGAVGRPQKNPISMLSQWKIFDNLRRSLTPSALTLLLILGWTVLPSAWFWTLAVMGITLLPPFLASALEFFQKPNDAILLQHLTASWHSAERRFAQAAFNIVCLPYEAFFTVDAIARTMWRTLVTRRRLLEWNPSDCIRDNTGDFRQDGLAAVCKAMWIAPVLAVSVAIYLIVYGPAALAAAFPILGLWTASPAIVWWVSQPFSRRETRLTREQTLFLRKISRKTWAFFETFVGRDDNWLPPDNYQEYRVATVAHRTSPTNMGLALLANMSAYDFGYILAGQLLERTTNALRTMEVLDKYQGHFYNWYDTQTLKPLLPFYVSTVDSGNLAAHLLTLRAGLLELPGHKILGPQFFEGLGDTLMILLNAAAGINQQTSIHSQLAQLSKYLESACESKPSTLADAKLCIEHMAAIVDEVINGLKAVDIAPDNEAMWWSRTLSTQCRAALDDLDFIAPPAGAGLNEIPTLRELADMGGSQATERIMAVDELAQKLNEFAGMEYDFLYDADRHLLAIGYNAGERRRDLSYYDLLASEARLSCFVAIAQRKLPQESWFALGRLLTLAGGEPMLLSWGGSMFEYLMPLLVMSTYEHTLLDQTYKAAVDRQIEYGKLRGIPWGMSESGYNTVDVHLNYQYRAFGVPGLGLKRGLADDLVIAPYASVLALMVAAEKACVNMQRLSAEGFEARYGFYEAVDYTPSRQRRGQERVIVRSFMAHHQGMSLLSLSHLLLDRPMQKRFESDPLFQATMLLLQERIPRTTGFYLETPELSDVRTTPSVTEMPVRVFSTPDTPIPEVQLLSNGRYHVMITNAGGGYSQWKDLAVTRWREDSSLDNWGTFCYIREIESGEYWSAAYQPTLKRSKNYEAIFSEGKAEFRSLNHELDTHTEIAVSPEDDIELRRITIVNKGKTRKEIEVTSYAEVVLARPASDTLHPAFSNLFVQTEIDRQQRAIICTRRPRSVDEHTPWMFHMMTAHGPGIGEVSYETDRMKFIGRGRTVINPIVLSSPGIPGEQGSETEHAGNLSGSEGSVLDPIVSIRYRITLEAEDTAVISMVSGVGDTRDACLGLVGKYQDRHIADRVFDLAWTHSQVLLQQLNASEADAQLYGRLAGSVIYANSLLRADTSVLRKNRRGQSGLWGYAISGDLPIVLLQIEDVANINLVRQLIQAHMYWRLKGLAVDLVIWNEDHAGYRQVLQDRIMGLIASGIEANVTDRPGGIFVRPGDQISNDDRVLIQAVARAIISDSRGSLSEQINRRGPAGVYVPRLIPTRPHIGESMTAVALPRHDLIFFNGLGGFTDDGREYIITTTHEQVTPAPWVNVLSNPHLGSVISESGQAYTWTENAHEFRLTPWYNDPVGDTCGEAFYIRDEESGHFWSPMPLPRRGAMHYVSRHGMGYSVFEHTEDDIRSEVWVYAAIDAPVKFIVLKIYNESGRPRRLSATGYVEWVLGDLRSKTAMHVITEIDPGSGVLFARNPYNTEFSDRVAFFDTDDLNRTITGDRTEFLGRNGTLRDPAAMSRLRLSGMVGTALDPCAAIQVPFDLANGQSREIIFRLGAGRNTHETTTLTNRFRGPAAARGALEAVWQYWNRTLGTIQVETPDPAVNVMTNCWLLYQTLACRFWARSGYYQSGGAYGFRDQLQDSMALIHSEPGLVRKHILLCASRQFKEGDVQHWWHPPLGRGVRTHCSDDFLWLPLATARYVLTTGDTGILDEPVHFVEGRPVNPDEDSYYDLAGLSEEAASLYSHCVLAILNGLNFGEHGLPLIGAGDWNDGMNLVGEHGKGESVWLGFFLYDVLMQFAEIALLHGDQPFVERCRREAVQLRRNIELNGWDGEWYLRAFFDDGTPLGSSNNPECRIDSIAQSWSVLSGAGDAERSHMAMEAVDKLLVRRDRGIIQLLDPPFDKSGLNPGYIKGYVPGVRENGGQYTHAAIWTAMAFAALGDNSRAWELLSMINPVHHGASPEMMATYKVEPYVVAADVYGVSPHVGRGGWTWYTGSAGWMYRLIVESLLGIRLEINKLRFAACLPVDWGSFKMHYRYRETVYHITVLQTSNGGRASVTVDGVEEPEMAIPLVDDHQEHSVEVRIHISGGNKKQPV